MTARQKGLTTIGALVRRLVPPQLDFVVIIYPMNGPLQGRVDYTSSVTVEEMAKQGNKRAIDAAAVFVATHKIEPTQGGGN